MSDIDIRPYGGLPNDPFDRASFAHRQFGTRGLPFTHIVVIEVSQARPRYCYAHCTSAERALEVAREYRRRNPGRPIHVEELP